MPRFRASPGKEDRMEEGKKKRKYTEGVKQSNRQWDAKNLDRLSVAAPKGTKDRWKAAAEARGQSLNQFIVDTVEADMVAPDSAQERPQAGGLQLPTEALKTAQDAAQATGEAVSKFVERAVVTQAERDRKSWSLGINPVTGEKAGE